MAAACKDDETPPNPPPEFPKEIPIEEYKLNGISCKWSEDWYDSLQSLNQKIKDSLLNANPGVPLSHYPPELFHQFENYLTIINSNEELEYHLKCTTLDYPEIDFNQYSLFLIRWHYSTSYNLISETFFIQDNEKKIIFDFSYKAHIGLPVPANYNILYLVSKLPEETQIISFDFKIESFKGRFLWEIELP